MNPQLTDREKQRLGALLTYAAERGETDEAIRLLEQGADPNAVGDGGTSAFVWAARRGDQRLVEELIRRGAAVDTKDSRGQTPLQWAIREGHQDAAERLLAAGADVRHADADGHTALHFAAARGDRAMAEGLLARGAARDAVDRFDDTPLTLAAAGAHFDTVRFLADQGADINIRGNGGRTAFLLAAMENRIAGGEDKAAQLRELLSRGADPQIADDYGWTPLMRAAHDGDDAVVQFLLEQGGDIDHADGQGLTAFMWAARGRKTGMMRLLAASGASVDARNSQGQTALFQQVRDPDPGIVGVLLELGADPNSKDARGNTVLMAAVRKQNQEMAGLLLEHGADLHATDATGETALDIAANAGMDELAHFLVTRGGNPVRPLVESLGVGADIDGPDDRGWTPLGRAARDGDVGRIHLLLDAGANIEVAASDGVTPLMIAAERSGVETVQTFLGRGANVHAADSQGESALHHLVKGQRIDNLPAILEARADIDAANADGATPLMAAIKQYDTALANALLDAGADVNHQDSRGCTPLMLAIRHRNPEIVDRLLALGADTGLRNEEKHTAYEVALGLNEPELAARLAPSAGPPVSRPLPSAGAQVLWEVPESVLAKLNEMMPGELPNSPANGPGYVLDANREVDCGCDVGFHRPVFRDHTGINFRVTACMRCGTVTVTESLVDEPHPNDVQCVGNVIQAVAPDALSWLSAWPRLAWGVWHTDRSVYLPADLRVSSTEELEQAEQVALNAERAVGLRERIEFAGYPRQAAPASLPERLMSFRETWQGLRLAETDSLETLLKFADERTWAAPFAHDILLRRPNIAHEIAFMLRSGDPVRHRAAKSLVDRNRLSDPEIVDAVISLVKAASRTETKLGPLLDTLYHIGPAAAAARPLLLEIADAVGQNDYYLHKRILQVRELIKPNGHES